MRKAAFALALLLALGSRVAAEDQAPEAQTPEPSPSPTAAAAVESAAAPNAAGTPASSARPLTPAAFVASAAVALDGELALLDGGPLSAALLDLARSGKPLRLLLDPGQRSTRLQGVALRSATPTAQVRWKHRAGKLQRRLLADGQAVLQWGPGKDPELLQGADELEKGRQRFERQWAGAAQELPEAQRLEDALQALPDPTENSPHFIRRRDASGE